MTYNENIHILSKLETKDKIEFLEKLSMQELEEIEKNFNTNYTEAIQAGVVHAIKQIELDMTCTLEEVEEKYNARSYFNTRC